MWVNTKSKSYKAFVSFLVAILLVFTYEVNRPKAVVPLLIWGGGILAGVVLEEMLEMGIKHVTADGKTKSKTKAGKVADAVLNNLDDFDFDNTTPKRRADGTLEIDLSANDRAKIARKIADEFGDVITEDETRRDSNMDYDFDSDGDDSGDPFYQTGVRAMVEPDDFNNGGNHMAVEYLTKLHRFEFSPVPYQKKTKITAYSALTGSKVLEVTVLGNTSGAFELNNFQLGASNPYKTLPMKVMQGYFVYKSTTGYSSVTYYNNDITTMNYYLQYLKMLEATGKKIYYGDGMAVPETIKQVYKVGDDMRDDYPLPNKQQLSNKPYKIPNYFPPSESDSDVTWEVLGDTYDNDVSHNNSVNQKIDTYLENGDINNVNNYYNTQTINNYYTDSNYPVKADDIRIEIDVDNDVVVKPPGDDDGNGTTVHDPHVEHIEDLNKGMFTIMKESYDYLGDSLDNALLSMKDVTDDATGIIVYLDTAFDWLPSQWRALFGSAFVLGIFAHFFRR